MAVKPLTDSTCNMFTSGVCHVNLVDGSAPFSCFFANSAHSGWRSVCE